MSKPSNSSQPDSNDKPTRLQKRLQNQTDGFDFDALLSGVSTLDKEMDDEAEANAYPINTGSHLALVPESYERRRTVESPSPLDDVPDYRATYASRPIAALPPGPPPVYDPHAKMKYYAMPISMASIAFVVGVILAIYSLGHSGGSEPTRIIYMQQPADPTPPSPATPTPAPAPPTRHGKSHSHKPKKVHPSTESASDASSTPTHHTHHVDPAPPPAAPRSEPPKPHAKPKSKPTDPNYGKGIERVLDNLQ